MTSSKTEPRMHHRPSSQATRQTGPMTTTPPKGSPDRPTRGLSVLAVVALAVSALVLFRPSAGASSVSSASPTPVAVVDLFRVINSLDEFKAISDQIAASTETANAEIERLDAEIEGLREDLQGLDRDSDAFDELFRELDMKASFRELRASRLIRWQSEDSARLLIDLYEKAVEAVAEVAQRDGWEMVVHTGQQTAVPRNPNVRAEQAMNFVEEWIQSRRVIYAGDRVDISDSVITHMNNQYAAGG